MKIIWQEIARRSLPMLMACGLTAIGSQALAADGAVSFVDQSDREVTLDKPAERVATIPIPAASMFVSLDGGTDRLAAMHKLSKSALLEGVLGDFFPQSKDVPSDIVGEGFMPNIESLLSVNPDLVFQWAHRGDDIIAPITNAGLKVATFRYGTEELARGWITTMGAVIGNPEKAERLIAWRDEVMAKIKAKTDEIADADRPRTLYFLRFNSELKVAGEGAYNSFYIDLAGGQNPALDGPTWQVVGPEQILEWNPEVILLNGFESDLSPQDVYDNPLLVDVAAVKNKRVYRVPLGGYRWDPPNQESPLMWMWLSQVLHPDLFDWDLRAEIKSAYEWIYGQVPTDEQIDGILRVSQNGSAANYTPFVN